MSSASPIITTSNQNAQIPNTNFTVQFVIDQLNAAATGPNCPKNWQIYAKNFDDGKFVFESLSGTGFLSVITRITFFFNNSQQQFSVIMKVPTIEIVRHRCQHFAKEDMDRIGSMIGIYHATELAFYTQIVPNYLRAVPKLGKLIAQIYAHSDTFILMEDLTPKGEHRNGAIDQISDQKMVESVVEAMALLHAHSLSIPANVLQNLFKPQMTVKVRSRQLSNSVVHQRICSMPAPMGPYFCRHSDKLTKFLETTKSGPGIERNIAQQLGIDLPVLCHGDLWLNNLLFDRFDGRITGILDWQFAHYGNGISDIAHFLLNGVDAELRTRCTARCLHIYHETFAKCRIGQFVLVPPAVVGGDVKLLVPANSDQCQMPAAARCCELVASDQCHRQPPAADSDQCLAPAANRFAADEFDQSDVSRDDVPPTDDSNQCRGVLDDSRSYQCQISAGLVDQSCPGDQKCFEKCQIVVADHVDQSCPADQKCFEKCQIVVADHFDQSCPGDQKCFEKCQIVVADHVDQSCPADQKCFEKCQIVVADHVDQSCPADQKCFEKCQIVVVDHVDQSCPADQKCFEKCQIVVADHVDQSCPADQKCFEKCQIVVADHVDQSCPADQKCFEKCQIVVADHVDQSCPADQKCFEKCQIVVADPVDQSCPDQIGNDCITLHQVHTLYAAVFPCQLHSEISVEALLHGMMESDGAEGGGEESDEFAKLIWHRICAAFHEIHHHSEAGA